MSNFFGIDFILFWPFYIFFEVHKSFNYSYSREFEKEKKKVVR